MCSQLGSDLMGGGFGYGRERIAAKKHNIQPRERQTTFFENPPSEKVKPRVFISFHMEDELQVKLLRYQAKNSDKLEFTDYSVKEPFDEKWKTQCTERIKRSSVLVVAIGEDTHSREAVLWEIRKAHELNKPVIGMRIYGDKNHRIPAPMLEHGDRVIGWKLDVLQSEINRAMAERDGEK